MGAGIRQAAIALTLALAACGGGRAANPTPDETPSVKGGAQPSTEPSTPGPEGDDDDMVIAAVQQAVNASSAAIHACWARAAADDFRLSGRVVVEVEVAAGGKVSGTRVVEDSTGDSSLTGCVAEVWGRHPWPPEAFTVAQTFQLPIEFGAPPAQYVVTAAHAPSLRIAATGGDEDPTARFSHATAVLTPENTGNDAVTLTLLSVHAPLAPHRHDVTELLYVVSGEGELVSSKPRALRAGDAVFVAPGVMHGVRATGKDGIALIEIHAPAGAERHTSDHAPGAAPGAKLRGPAPIVRSTGKARSHAIAGGKGKAVILFDAGTAVDDAASLVAMTLDAGVAVPLHRHDGSTEVLYLFEGKGVMTAAGQAIPVAAGDAIQIPSGIEHGFTADTGGPVKALQSYVPGGPEQRFKGTQK